MRDSRKLDFLICGSATPGFFSQMAFFKLSLTALGGDYANARMVCTFGDHESEEFPAGWKRYFDGIEVEWAHLPGESNPSHSRQHDLRFDVMRSDATAVFICDADVAMLSPPDKLLAQLDASPAIAGVIAHFHFPWENRERLPDVDWPEIAHAVLGKDIERPFRYTLLPQDTPPTTPFYINLGMLAAPPDLLREFHERDRSIRPRVAELLDHWWAPQVSLPLTCAELGLPVSALPMRYNYPNDPRADALYPDEMEEVVFLHYLRTRLFKRAEIFTNHEAFDAFLNADLTGSNRIFQEGVLRLTGGEFPFPVTD